jgi:hypothetical protein
MYVLPHAYIYVYVNTYKNTRTWLSGLKIHWSPYIHQLHTYIHKFLHKIDYKKTCPCIKHTYLVVMVEAKQVSIHTLITYLHICTHTHTRTWLSGLKLNRSPPAVCSLFKVVVVITRSKGSTSVAMASRVRPTPDLNSNMWLLACLDFYEYV